MNDWHTELEELFKRNAKFVKSVELRSKLLAWCRPQLSSLSLRLPLSKSAQSARKS